MSTFYALTQVVQLLDYLVEAIFINIARGFQ